MTKKKKTQAELDREDAEIWRAYSEMTPFGKLRGCYG